MSNYDKYEEEINIFTLLWFVISKWKSILIIAVIGLVLGAGYQVKSMPINESSMQETANEANANLIAAEQTYEASKARVAALESYVADAAVMNINPYELYKGTLNYTIDAASGDLAAINASIYGFVWDGELMNALEEVGPYTVSELEALLGFAQSASSEMILDENAFGQATARISIMAASEDEVIALLQQMDSSVREYLDEMRSVVDYTTVSTTIKKTTSTGLADYQSNIRSKYDAEKTNLNTYKANLDTLLAEGSTVNETNAFDSLLKYAAVGFLGGLIISIIIWVCIYYLCDKPYTVSKPEEKFGVKVLGHICDMTGKLRIDGWIMKKLMGEKYVLPVSDQMKLAAINVLNELSKCEHSNNIYICSSLPLAENKIQFMEAVLEEKGYQVQMCAPISKQVDFWSYLTHEDAVLLIEDKKVSQNTSILKEIKNLEVYTEKILGMIFV